MVGANALLVIQAGSGTLDAGDEVEALVLDHIRAV
jgi:hypothetical protein